MSKTNLNFDEFRRTYARTEVIEHPNQVVADPQVSILVVTYNHRATIEQTLKSILAQEVDFSYEICLGEDASSDGTRELCLDYAEKYPDKIRLFLHSRDNVIKVGGCETGRFNATYLFYKARGRYIVICEGDDYWIQADKLRRQVLFLEQNPDYALCFHNAIVMVEDDNTWKQKHRYSDFNWCKLNRTKKDYSVEDFIESPLCPTASALYRRPNKVVFPDWYFSVPSGDIPLFCIVVGNAKARYMDLDASVYRKHAGGVTAGHKGDYIHVGRIVTYLGLLAVQQGQYAGTSAATIRSHLREVRDYDNLRQHPFSLKLHRRIEPLVDQLESGHSFRGIYQELGAILEGRKAVPSINQAVFIMHGPNQVNGPNIWLMRLLPQLVRRGMQITVLAVMATGKRCEVVHALEATGVRVDILKPSYTVDSVRQILHFINEHPTEVLVPNLNVPGYFATSLLLQSGLSTVGVLHSDDDFHHDLEDEFLLGKQGKYLSACVVVSKQQKERLATLDTSGSEIVLAPYGAPVPEEHCRYSKKPFRCIYVGRLRDEQKRVTDMVVGMLSVMRQSPEVKFHLCGEGNARPQVEKLIADAGMSERILLHGNLSQESVRELSLKCQAYILLSDYEGIPIALMEAMACGLVPICSDIRSGIPELITDGVEGLIVQDRGPALYQAVIHLLEEPDRWQQMSQAARSKIKAHYSTEKNVAIWADLLKKLAHEEPVSRQQAIQLPDVIELPPKRSNPLGMAREDHRKPTAEAAFTAPSLTPNNADLYWQRKSILEAIRSAKPLLDGTFLDVGCGIMPYRAMLTDEGSRIERYIGMDIETDIYKADVDLRWDGQKIPLEDDSVDSAMATEVLEHCPEPLVVLKEIRRVLKPGGVFFFTVPNLWPLHDAPHDYWRYTPFSLKKLLGEAGFEDVDVKALSGWDASLAQMMGLWLKRAPMSAERRQAMAQKLWPLYQELVQTDQLPADSEAGNTMATGWSGLAFAGKAGGRESSHPEVEAADLPLVIARSHERNYSETFIQDHVDSISAGRIDLSGWPFPRFVNGRSILDETGEAALVDSIKHQRPISEAASRAYVAGVAKWLKQSGAKVVLLESGVMGAFLYPACEKAGIPYVVHFHGVDAWKADLLQLWKAKYDRFFQGAAGVIGVSREMVEQLQKLGAPEERLLHAPYGVSVAVERLAEPQTAPPVFVAVGRFVEKKAPQKTLQAFAAMRGKVPEARLVMVGDGPLLKDCRKWVAQQGLEDAVTFAGVLSRRAVSRLLSTARAFVQHSVAAEDGDREGLPLAILEAGAHGLPVVATRHAGIPDAVREDHDGMLVDEGDIKGMAVALWKLAAQPELAGRMGRSFRERVQAHYSRKVSIERLQRILHCAAEGRPVKEALSSEEKPAETRKPAHSAGSATAAKLAEGREAMKNGKTEAAATAFEGALARDRNCGEALVQLGSLAAGQGDYETAYLYLKEAQRVGALPEGAESTLRALEGNSELQTDVVRAYQERIGMGGMGQTERPRRVLVFTNLLPPQEMGGFGRTVWEFCDGLLQRGHDVRILTADLPELQQQPYADYERVERHVRRNLQLFGHWQGGAARTLEDQGEIQRIALHDVRTILQEVKAFRPDLCMAGNLDFLSGAMLDPILEQGIPVVHRLGNASPGYAADATPKSDLYCIAGCSNWVNRQLQENGYRAKHFAVLPAGAPLHEYYRVMPPAMDQLRICYAGLIMAYKGPHLLVQALGMLKKIGVPFSCEFAGDTKDPKYFAQLKALVRKNGIEKQVRFLGFQDRAGLAAMFARNNTLVFPSVFQEPFGKVQIEAQAAGLAVVRSAVGGYEDMLEDEKNGLLFRGEDAEDLARQLYVLQGDKELWARLAAQGQADAYRFTTRNCVELLEAILEALLEKRG